MQSSVIKRLKQIQQLLHQFVDIRSNIFLEDHPDLAIFKVFMANQYNTQPYLFIEAIKKDVNWKYIHEHFIATKNRIDLIGFRKILISLHAKFVQETIQKRCNPAKIQQQYLGYIKGEYAIINDKITLLATPLQTTPYSIMSKFICNQVFENFIEAVKYGQVKLPPLNIPTVGQQTDIYNNTTNSVASIAAIH